MDPFDLFEMFFTGGMNGHFRRAENMHRRQQHQHNNENNRRAQRNIAYVQFLPFIIIILFSVVPYLFQSVLYSNIETLLSVY
jgi:hypothetical protein